MFIFQLAEDCGYQVHTSSNSLSSIVNSNVLILSNRIMEKEELSVTSMCAENLYLTLNLYVKDAINKYILIQNFSHKMK